MAGPDVLFARIAGRVSSGRRGRMWGLLASLAGQERMDAGRRRDARRDAATAERGGVGRRLVRDDARG